AGGHLWLAAGPCPAGRRPGRVIRRPASGQPVRSASTGGRRAARRAGYSPATAPTAAAIAGPPQIASAGISGGPPRREGLGTGTATPLARPAPPPAQASTTGHTTDLTAAGR